MEQRSIIKGLSAGLPERGKIKIGKKGHVKKSKAGNEYQLPQKLDHFLITTLVKDETGNFIQDEVLTNQYADEKTKKITKIPIHFWFNEIEKNFPSRYACYNGRKVICSGDGETGIETGKEGTIPCPCARFTDSSYQGSKCKMNGVLNCQIAGAKTLGGVWKFRTTSYNTITGIYSSLVLFSQRTGGQLAGIEFNLVINPKIATTPDGKSQTIYVVGLEFDGDLNDLREKGFELLKASYEHKDRIDRIEQDINNKNLLTAGAIDAEEEAEIAEEYYPGEIVDKKTGEILSASEKIHEIDGEVEESEREEYLEEQTDPETAPEKPKKSNNKSKSKKNTKTVKKEPEEVKEPVAEPEKDEEGDLELFGF